LGISGVLLALTALVSPIEVRYLLAVVPLLAVLASSILDSGDSGSFPGQTLSAVVDVPGLRLLGAEKVFLPLSVGLVGASVLGGIKVLLEFIPLSGL
jgi:hypothetical protein